MVNKIAERSLRRTIGGLFNNDLCIGSVSNIADSGRTVSSRYVLDSIGSGHLLIAADIEGITNSFRDC